MTAYSIRPFDAGDWDPVRAIYLEGINTRNATFETAAPTWEEWDASHWPFARLAAHSNHVILGWAALSPVSTRACYAGVAEASIYVAVRHAGRGIGKALLQALVEASERNGVWTLQAGIFPENAASMALIRSCGFREIGRRERIGRLDGRWRDVVLFERRSKVTGI